MIKFFKIFFKKRKIKSERAKYLAKDLNYDLKTDFDRNINFYCKVFIDTNAEKNKIIDLLENNKIKVKFFNNISLDVLKKNNDSGYVYYPYYIEIEPKMKLSSSIFIHEVSIITTKLRLLSNDIFTQCDFEQELNLAELNLEKKG